MRLEEAGPILGILPDAQFSNIIVPLESGDIIALFTDGVTEQEDEKGDEFSIDRLEEIIRSQQTESAATLVAHISEAVSTFAGANELSDDLTVVVVKVL